jgi:hypothetical protein
MLWRRPPQRPSTLGGACPKHPTATSQALCARAVCKVPYGVTHCGAMRCTAWPHVRKRLAQSGAPLQATMPMRMAAAAPAKGSRHAGTHACATRSAPFPTPPPTRVISSLTPVRMLADRVRSSLILQYQHCACAAWGPIVAPTPHGCLLNYDLSDTVGFTPHIGQWMHDGLCPHRGPTPLVRSIPRTLLSGVLGGVSWGDMVDVDAAPRVAHHSRSAQGWGHGMTTCCCGVPGLPPWLTPPSA